MKICQQHWNKLKEMIKQEGLSKFIAKDGRAAMGNALAELKGESTHPDPLMMCNNMIWSRSLETFGLVIMQEDCPLCYANENYPDTTEGEKTGEFWVRTLVPHVKKMFEEKGLLNTN